jgi:hypothetical protein
MADTILAKIQIRRGDYVDLPMLQEGEFGYALDTGRLFLGNPRTVYIGTGDSAEFQLDLRFIRPGAPIFVFVDEIQKQPQIEYSVSGARLVFNDPPLLGQQIIVGYNSEVSMIGQAQNVDLVRLDPKPIAPAPNPPRPTGILINWEHANTGIFDFTLRSGNTIMLGTFNYLTDGVDVEMNSTVNSLGASQPCYLSARLLNSNTEGKYVSIDYINETANPFNFYYTARVWKSA